jgi:uncharacterized phage protein (TIGR01671 family)
MEREIKFRAWNIEQKVMCYDNEDSRANYWDGVNSSDVNMVNNIFNPWNQIYIWMQYTGLKDKNSKDIYEGDIVSISKKMDWLPLVLVGNKYEVSYISAFAQYSMFLVKSDYTFINDLSSDEEVIDFNNDVALTIEVIGNIYENPELLENDSTNN